MNILNEIRNALKPGMHYKTIKIRQDLLDQLEAETMRLLNCTNLSQPWYIFGMEIIAVKNVDYCFMMED